MKMLLFYSAVVVAGVAIGAGCRSPAPSHCFNNEGDQSCGEGRFCNSCLAEGDGCVDAMPSDGCHFPGPAEEGSSSSGEATSGETTTTPQPTTESEDGGTTGPTLCVDDDDCPAEAAPFCDTSRSECVACSELVDPDAACAGRFPDTPLCEGADCVECRPDDPLACGGEHLLCDEASHACVPCTEHGQCGSGACELAVGQCFAAGAIVEIAGNAQSLFNAVSNVEPGGSQVFMVHELAGDAAYNGVLVDQGKTIALLAAPGDRPRVAGTGGDPSLRGQGAGTSLYVDGLRVVGNLQGRGVELDTGALAWLDRSHIVQNTDGGILATTGAELTLRNGFVGGGTDVMGIDINGASANIVYSTVGTSTFGMVPVLSCSGSGVVDVRNSIVMGQGDDPTIETSCAAASVTHSATEANVGPVVVGWFVDFNNGDFSLTASGGDIFAGLAQWQAGDPETDIDGDDRPSIVGAADHAGADIP